MKYLILAAFFTNATFAGPLKLDYSCRIKCYQAKSIQSSHGVGLQKTFTQIYRDFQDITRKQFDDMMTSKNLTEICLNKLGEEFAYESHDCDVFKH